MCFGGDDPKPVTPEEPAEVLEQVAPKKKTANQDDANSLAIGTKKYRSPAASANSGYPSVQQ